MKITTKASTTPTNIVRWQTQGYKTSTRLYKVIGGYGDGSVSLAFMGCLYGGVLYPHTGHVRPLRKRLHKFVKYVNLQFKPE